MFKPFVDFLFDLSMVVLLLWILFVICVSCHTVLPCGHLLGKGCPLCSLVCGVFLCFCHFPKNCPGSGVLFDCMVS